MSGKLGDVIRIGVAVLLGGIGAAAGFTHTREWAEHNGQHGWLAWATAVVIEGMAVVAGFEIHHDRHTHRNRPADRPGDRPGRRKRVTLPVVVLTLAVLVQMTAQVAEATPTPAGWLIAAMPALGFLAVVKLLMRRLPATETPPPDHDPEPDPAPAPVAMPAERVEPATVPQTAAVPRVKLPPALADRITNLVTEIRAEGREPTAEDIRRAVKIPGPMAAQILDALPPATGQPVNGHTIP